MTGLEMQLGFQREISQLVDAPDFNTDDTFYWLNEALYKFAKTRYSGLNLKSESFEQTQKRIDDLRTLVVEEKLDLVDGTSNVHKPYSRIASLSSLSNDYWFALGEEALIAFVPITSSGSIVASGDLVIGNVYKVITASITHDGTVYEEDDYFVATLTTYTGSGGTILCSTLREAITEATIENYVQKLSDPYSEHILHYDRARPLRLFYQGNVELISDGNYGIIYYYLRYLKKPQNISLSVACDLPEHTHNEIVKMAANMALENLEKRRYQTHAVEVGTME